ncbi:MAG: TatD family hydrolase [Promethearchaeota archaeon]
MKGVFILELFDSHSHIEMPRLYPSAAAVVKRAKAAGVIGVVVSPIEPKFYTKALDLVERFPGYIWATFGLHPPRTTPRTVKQCIRLIREHSERILAIGEVGLDYYWEKSEQKRELQRHHFIEFIRLADELELPLVVHSREAEADAIRILKEEQATRLQLHCFNDSSLVAEAASENWFMSVPTSVVSRRRMQRIAQMMPLANMLLETDAPWLAPQPRQQNEPANLPLAVAKIAELQETTEEVVAESTTKNALELFNLELYKGKVQRR